jgi:hypothetical protein
MASGKVQFDAELNTAGFESGARRLEARTTSMARAVSTAFSQIGGLLAGGAVVAGLQGVLDKFGRIQDLAERFGTSAESIQRVGNAAKLAGADMEMVARVMTKMGVSASNAADNGGEMGDKFAKAGISAREFASAQLDQKLVMVAQALQAAGGDASKTNAILALLGTRGADLVPLLSNVDALKKALADTAVVADKSVKDIARADDALVQLKNNLLVGGVGSVLTTKDAIESAAKGTLDWRQALATLTKTFADNVGEMGPQGAAIMAVAAATKQAGEEAQEAADKNAQAGASTQQSLEDTAEAWKVLADAPAGYEDAALKAHEAAMKAATKEREELEKLNRAYEDAQQSKAQSFAARDRELMIRDMELAGDPAAAALRAADAADAAGFGGMDQLSQEQRAKFIEQELAKNAQTVTGGGGGGGGSALATPSAFLTGEQLRAEAEKAGAMGRARQQLASGNFRSAGNTISGAEARAAERMANSANMDAALGEFGSREGLNSALEDFNAGRSLMDRMSPQEFANMRADMQKPEAQRKAEEEETKRGGKSRGPAPSPMDPTQTKLDTVIKLMTERLPIRVLAA